MTVSIAFATRLQEHRHHPRVVQCGQIQRIIVPVTCNLLQFQFEVSTLPEVKRIDWSLILKLRLHCFHDLIKDLLTKLIQEDTTLIMGVCFVLHNIDVGIVREFAFLLTEQYLYLLRYHCSTVHDCILIQGLYHPL